MNPLSRRSFISTLGVGAVALKTLPLSAFAQAATTNPKVWIDRRLADLPRRPWRKIHQDFHNTAFIGKIGEKFDADEYGDEVVCLELAD